MIFVDINYFLRFLLADEKNQHGQAKKLFENGATGKIKLFTSLIVFFEIYWVLSSFYKKDKKIISKVLRDLLKMSFIIISERNVLEKALNISQKKNLDLEDSFNLAYAQEKNAESFKTFDKKYEQGLKVFDANK